MQEQTIELIRYGKNNVKIRYRKQVLFTVFNPGFPLSILALGTMAVTAGVIAYANMPALIAFINMSAQRRCTATL